jgi:hypothetical protein
MKKICLFAVIVLLSGCQMEKTPQYGNATVYTTPGSPGGVSRSEYTVTPL